MGVGSFTARLQLRGARIAGRDGFVRGRVDSVTEFSRSQLDGLSPDAIANAADRVVGFHAAAGGALVHVAMDRASRTEDMLGSGPDAYGLPSKAALRAALLAGHRQVRR